MRRWPLLIPLATAFVACMLPRSVYVEDEETHLAHHAELVGAYGADCLPELLPADATSSVARPGDRPADHVFAGDFYGQVEHVWLEGETYSYSERWDMGVLGDWSLANVGWDWKVECRMLACPLSDAAVCCYQECVDGGASGLGYEAPDRFGCMNTASGGAYQWFIDGLRQAGVRGVDACR